MALSLHSHRPRPCLITPQRGICAARRAHDACRAFALLAGVSRSGCQMSMTSTTRGPGPSFQASCSNESSKTSAFPSSHRCVESPTRMALPLGTRSPMCTRNLRQRGRASLASAHQ